MLPLIFSGVKVVVEGETFADLVELKLLPHFGLWELLSANLAALSPIPNPFHIWDVVFCNSPPPAW